MIIFSNKKRTNKIKEATDTINRLNIKNPPLLFCPRCGVKLDFKIDDYWHEQRNEYNIYTGQKLTDHYLFVGFYRCPNHHIFDMPSMWFDIDVNDWETYSEFMQRNGGFY